MNHKVPVVTLTLVNAQWSGLLRMKTHWCDVRLCFCGSIQTQGRDKLISDCDNSLSQQQIEMLKRAMAPLKFLKWGQAFRETTKKIWITQ